MDAELPCELRLCEPIPHSKLNKRRYSHDEKILHLRSKSLSLIWTPRSTNCIDLSPYLLSTVGGLSAGGPRAAGVFFAED